MSEYHTNQWGEIIRVDDSFVDFARENWRQDFKPDDLVGDMLLDHITDATTRALYLIVIQHLQESNRSITLPFRCDSPDIRRYMELTITPFPDGGMKWSCRLLRQEHRNPADILAGDLERSDRLLLVCSWCKRCKMPEWLVNSTNAASGDVWVEVEEIMGLLGTLTEHRLPGISHTACPDCYQELMAAIDAMDVNPPFRG